MSTGYCMEVLNHYVVHLKVIQHCTLINWNVNKNLKRKEKTYSWPTDNMTDHQGNANENYNIITPHTCQNG